MPVVVCLQGLATSRAAAWPGGDDYTCLSTLHHRVHRGYCHEVQPPGADGQVRCGRRCVDRQMEGLVPVPGRYPQEKEMMPAGYRRFFPGVCERGGPGAALESEKTTKWPMAGYRLLRPGTWVWWTSWATWTMPWNWPGSRRAWTPRVITYHRPRQLQADDLLAHADLDLDMAGPQFLYLVGQEAPEVRPARTGRMDYF